MKSCSPKRLKRFIGGMSSLGNASQVSNGLGLVQGLGGIGQMTGNLIGNTASGPDKAGAWVGNSLSGLSQGAMSGAAFGPLGIGIGAAAGLVGGLVKSHQAQKAYKQELEEKQKGFELQDNELKRSYNPMTMKRGGYTPQEQAEKRAAMNLKDRPVPTYSPYMSPKSPGIYKAGTNSYTPFFNKRAEGGPVKPRLKRQDGGPQAGVEIEGGEAVIGDPNNMTLYGGADASHSSSLGFMAQGANHGQMNEAGTEGIPMQADENAYIGSKRLGLDGRAAGKGNPSVAASMKPYLDYAQKAENSKDKYANNPEAMQAINDELNFLKQQAEEGKFLEELHKMLKSKDRDYQEVMDFIIQSNPNEAEMINTKNPNLPDEQFAQMNEQAEMNAQAQAQDMQMQGMMEDPAMQEQMMMEQQMQGQVPGQQDPSMMMQQEGPMPEEQLMQQEAMMQQQPPMKYGGNYSPKRIYKRNGGKIYAQRGLNTEGSTDYNMDRQGYQLDNQGNVARQNFGYNQPYEVDPFATEQLDELVFTPGDQEYFPDQEGGYVDPAESNPAPAQRYRGDTGQGYDAYYESQDHVPRQGVSYPRQDSYVNPASRPEGVYSKNTGTGDRPLTQSQYELFMNDMADPRIEQQSVDKLMKTMQETPTSRIWSKPGTRAVVGRPGDIATTSESLRQLSDEELRQMGYPPRTIGKIRNYDHLMHNQAVRDINVTDEQINNAIANAKTYVTEGKHTDNSRNNMFLIGKEETGEGGDPSSTGGQNTYDAFLNFGLIERVPDPNDPTKFTNRISELGRKSLMDAGIDPEVVSKLQLNSIHPNMVAALRQRGMNQEADVLDQVRNQWGKEIQRIKFDKMSPEKKADYLKAQQKGNVRTFESVGLGSAINIPKGKQGEGNSGVNLNTKKGVETELTDRAGQLIQGKGNQPGSPGGNPPKPKPKPRQNQQQKSTTNNNGWIPRPSMPDVSYNRKPIAVERKQQTVTAPHADAQKYRNEPDSQEGTTTIAVKPTRRIYSQAPSNSVNKEALKKGHKEVQNQQLTPAQIEELKKKEAKNMNFGFQTEPDKKAYGGYTQQYAYGGYTNRRPMMRNGGYIKFERGGRIYQGIVKNYNPGTGDFELY